MPATRSILALSLVLCGSLAVSAPAAEALKPADPADAKAREGREFFRNRRYSEALGSLATALTLRPEDRDLAFLTGLAAYWAGRPAQALGFWNELFDSRVGGAREMWKIETHRVLALAALKRADATDAVVDHIYELRRKHAELQQNSGFTREHFYVRVPVDGGTQVLRVAAWEVFDDRNESQFVWQFSVQDPNGADDAFVRKLWLETTVLPAGEPGFVLTDEVQQTRHVYKRWIQKPIYAEIRALIVEILVGERKPIEDVPLTPTQNGAGKEAQQKALRGFSDESVALQNRISTLKVAPEVTRILLLAARLADVNFDVTRMTRLSLTDAELARRSVDELKSRAPGAQEDAAELVELLAKAKQEHVAGVFNALSVLGARPAYLDYTILIGLNTRGRDLPGAYLKQCALSPDALVRLTSALVLARAGERAALAVFFTELDGADAAGCTIAFGLLTELVGVPMNAPPPADKEGGAALRTWKKSVAQWWSEHRETLKHDPNPAPNAPYYK